MNISEIAAIVADLSPFVLALIAIVAFYRGWVIPQSVVASIVAETVDKVQARTQSSNDKVIVDVSARIIAAVDEMLKEHESRILRELDRKNGVKHL